MLWILTFYSKTSKNELQQAYQTVPDPCVLDLFGGGDFGGFGLGLDRPDKDSIGQFENDEVEL